MQTEFVLRAVCAAAMTWVAATSAMAQGPGLLFGTSVADDPSLAGTVVEQTTTTFYYAVRYDRHFPQPLQTDGYVSGSVLSQVLLARDGSYDFYWRVLVDPESFYGVVQFDLTDFYASALRANWRRDMPGAAAPRLWLSNGLEQTFLFRDESLGAVRPGQRSNYFFLDTNAREYARSARFAVNSEDGALAFSTTGRSGPSTTFAPLSVPEPQTWGLMLLGLVAVAAAAAKRRRS